MASLKVGEEIGLSADCRTRHWTCDDPELAGGLVRIDPSRFAEMWEMLSQPTEAEV
jgi:hypothetical protein